MKKFKVGNQAFIKDFSGGRLEDALPIETAKVIKVSDKQITFDIGYDKLSLKLRHSEKWDWCHYESIILSSSPVQ